MELLYYPIVHFHSGPKEAPDLYFFVGEELVDDGTQPVCVSNKQYSLHLSKKESLKVLQKITERHEFKIKNNIDYHFKKYQISTLYIRELTFSLHERIRFSRQHLLNLSSPGAIGLS
jgi:hypothetical protein